MLNEQEKNKIEDEVEQLLDSIRKETNNLISDGKSLTETIRYASQLTASKIAPESKMLILSAYNMMMDRTLSDPYFRDPLKKAALYELNIRKQITDKFIFSVPPEINTRDIDVSIKKIIATGTVTVVAGGIISIAFSSAIPVCIAIIVTGIMTLLINSKHSIILTKDKARNLINDYLEKCRSSFMLWIEAIENFYDERIEEIKETCGK